MANRKLDNILNLITNHIQAMCGLKKIYDYFGVEATIFIVHITKYTAFG